MSRLRAAALVVLAAGVGCLAAGAYIPAKAALAQVLLLRAWNRTGADGAPVRPWPWAKTWPVARLELPRRGVDAIVLAGAEGAALAFAPGHVDGTALPGEPGNSALAGHRDTVFAFLGDLGLDDEIVVETPDRRRVRYRVVDTRVVDQGDVEVLAPTAETALTLVTCYPIDAVRPGGPLRYVVRAVAGRSVAAGTHLGLRRRSSLPDSLAAGRAHGSARRLPSHGGQDHFRPAHGDRQRDRPLRRRRARSHGRRPAPLARARLIGPRGSSLAALGTLPCLRSTARTRPPRSARHLRPSWDSPARPPPRDSSRASSTVSLPPTHGLTSSSPSWCWWSPCSRAGSRPAAPAPSTPSWRYGRSRPDRRQGLATGPPGRSDEGGEGERSLYVPLAAA